MEWTVADPGSCVNGAKLLSTEGNSELLVLVIKTFDPDRSGKAVTYPFIFFQASLGRVVTGRCRGWPRHHKPLPWKTSYFLGTLAIRRRLDGTFGALPEAVCEDRPWRPEALSASLWTRAPTSGRGRVSGPAYSAA